MLYSKECNPVINVICELTGPMFPPAPFTLPAMLCLYAWARAGGPLLKGLLVIIHTFPPSDATSTWTTTPPPTVVTHLAITDPPPPDPPPPDPPPPPVSCCQQVIPPHLLQPNTRAGPPPRIWTSMLSRISCLGIRLGYHFPCRTVLVEPSPLTVVLEGHHWPRATLAVAGKW